MGQNKEQLNKLLQFIKRLIEEPGNDEFVHGLQELLSAHINQPADNSKLADIEKYLGLDYKLDSATPIIDYSFIKDDYVRERLNADNREMLRFRLGVRSHQVDFKEVCRYAIFQEELLINYYYSVFFKTLEEVKQYLKKSIEDSYCKRIKSKQEDSDRLKQEMNREIYKIDSYTEYEYIPLSTKIKAFSNEFGEDRILENARRVRNELSHRESFEETDIESDRKYLEDLGVTISDNGFIDSLQFTNNSALKLKVYRDKRYWAFSYKVWKRNKPTDEVIKSLTNFVKIIKNKLSQT